MLIFFADSSNFLSLIDSLKKSFFSNSLLSFFVSTPPCSFRLIFDGLDNATKECKDPDKLFDAMYGTLFYGKNFSPLMAGIIMENIQVIKFSEQKDPKGKFSILENVSISCGILFC